MTSWYSKKEVNKWGPLRGSIQHIGKRMVLVITLMLKCFLLFSKASKKHLFCWYWRLCHLHYERLYKEKPEITLITLHSPENHRTEAFVCFIKSISCILLWPGKLALASSLSGCSIYPTWGHLSSFLGFHLLSLLDETKAKWQVHRYQTAQLS